MILRKEFVDQVISEEGQRWEICRLKKSPSGAVLYKIDDGNNSDFIETFLAMADVRYQKCLENHQVTFRKC